MTLDEPGPEVVALLACVASFFFALAESALEHHSGPRLHELARRRNREDSVSAFLKQDDPIRLTCQMLAILAHAALVLAIFAWVQVHSAGPLRLTLLKAGGLSAAALLTVGRVVPLILGKIFAEPILLFLRPVLQTVHLVASPLTWIVLLVTMITERLAGKPVEEHGHEHLQEEILSAVEEGEMEGLLGENEAEMIEAALHLRDADVADCMTPRTRMFAVAVETPLAEAVRQVSAEGHSRVPIYRENPDHIVGILYAKDVLEHWESPEASELTLARIIRKPYYVPETKRIGHLLDEFKRKQTHMAIVLDEYGGTAGLITIEDILEELVGEIEDEFDDSLDVPLLSRLGEGEVEAAAELHVDDLGDALEVEIPSDEFDTVGGLVFTALGRIPRVGDEFDFSGLHITVLEADERRVNRVKAVKTA